MMSTYGFFKREIYLSNLLYKIILRFWPQNAVFGRRVLIGRKFLLVSKWWKCNYEILTNALFMEKSILNIRKVITKEKKTYITKWYEGILLIGDQFFGSNRVEIGQKLMLLPLINYFALKTALIVMDDECLTFLDDVNGWMTICHFSS